MTLMWTYGFISLILGIVFPIFGILVVIYGAMTPGANEKGLFAYIAHYWNQMSIEILRSWGKTVMWCLVMVLPGLWKYVEYTMIPFVVTLSPRYDSGEVDALKASAVIVKKNIWKISFILTFFHGIFPGLLTVFFDDYRLFWSTPMAAMLLTFVDVYLFILSTQMLLVIFEKEISGEITNQEAPHAIASV